MYIILFLVSPEVARGLEYDERTDWWGFGVLLYEMVYGQVPFQGENREVLINICTEEVKFPYLSKKCLSRQKVSIGFKNIVKQLLKKDPKERLTNPHTMKNQTFFNTIDFKSKIIIYLDILKLSPPYIPPADSYVNIKKRAHIHFQDKSVPRLVYFIYFIVW